MRRNVKGAASSCATSTTCCTCVFPCVQDLIAKKRRLEAEARGMENKQKQKAEIQAYEAQQQAFEAERKKTEEAVCLPARFRLTDGSPCDTVAQRQLSCCVPCGFPALGRQARAD